MRRCDVRSGRRFACIWVDYGPIRFTDGKFSSMDYREMPAIIRTPHLPPRSHTSRTTARHDASHTSHKGNQAQARDRRALHRSHEATARHISSLRRNRTSPSEFAMSSFGARAPMSRSLTRLYTGTTPAPVPGGRSNARGIGVRNAPVWSSRDPTSRASLAPDLAKIDPWRSGHHEPKGQLWKTFELQATRSLGSMM